MDRKEVERKIAEHMVAIRDLYHEYNPDGKYLSLTFWYDGHNGNDKGEWMCWTMDASNAYYAEDNGRPVNMCAHRDIKDDAYWACITPEEDSEDEEYLREYMGADVLEDGTHIAHRTVEVKG